MSGEEVEAQPIHRSLRDKSGAPLAVVEGGQEGGGGVSSGDRGCGGYEERDETDAEADMEATGTATEEEKIQDISHWQKVAELV